MKRPERPHVLSPRRSRPRHGGGRWSLVLAGVVAILLVLGGAVFRAERLKWEREPGPRRANTVGRGLARGRSLAEDLRSRATGHGVAAPSPAATSGT